MACVLVAACKSPEEKHEYYVERGDAFYEQSDYIKARLEYKLLRLKSSYAKDGLTLYMKKAYNNVMRQKKRLESIGRAMKASDAWLKGMAIRYDFDEDEAPNLLSAYKSHMKNKVKWYTVVFNYNLSVAKLIEKLGLDIKEYQKISEGAL